MYLTPKGSGDLAGLGETTSVWLIDHSGGVLSVAR
jgi:hypothetical protein